LQYRQGNQGREDSQGKTAAEPVSRRGEGSVSNENQPLRFIPGLRSLYFAGNLDVAQCRSGMKFVKKKSIVDVDSIDGFVPEWWHLETVRG
jgi:hypothetical protein